jgi:hypothetical protein
MLCAGFGLAGLYALPLAVPLVALPSPAFAQLIPCPTQPLGDGAAHITSRFLPGQCLESGVARAQCAAIGGQFQSIMPEFPNTGDCIFTPKPSAPPPPPVAAAPAPRAAPQPAQPSAAQQAQAAAAQRAQEQAAAAARAQAAASRAQAAQRARDAAEKKAEQDADREQAADEQQAEQELASIRATQASKKPPSTTNSDRPDLVANECVSFVFNPKSGWWEMHNLCPYHVTYTFCVQAPGTLFPCPGAGQGLQGLGDARSMGADPVGDVQTGKGPVTFFWYACRNDSQSVDVGPFLTGAGPVRGLCKEIGRG